MAMANTKCSFCNKSEAAEHLIDLATVEDELGCDLVEASTEILNFQVRKKKPFFLKSFIFILIFRLSRDLHAKTASKILYCPTSSSKKRRKSWTATKTL